MNAPKRNSRARTKKKTTEGKSWVLAAIPDDALGSASDAPPRPGPEAPPLAIDERFEHLVRNPALYAMAQQILPPQPLGKVGRPLAYPAYVYFIFLCSISIFGSARGTAAHLARAFWWDPVRMAVRDFISTEEADALPPTGPTRSQWNYFFHHHLKKIVPDVRDASREAWIQQALDHGLMANKSRGSWIYPEREQYCTATPRSHARPPTTPTRNSSTKRPEKSDSTGWTQTPAPPPRAADGKSTETNSSL
ncbi:hypothetical protein [Streptomyces sp. CT34]|uniref:hypothetical protein n=1 Tax=Streptomyces sp. CT34 TaxID=1553907 RepID=UPI0005B7EEA0|nr:hypothetical protein [Streptomyces sp. CT34]